MEHAGAHHQLCHIGAGFPNRTPPLASRREVKAPILGCQSACRTPRMCTPAATRTNRLRRRRTSRIWGHSARLHDFWFICCLSPWFAHLPNYCAFYVQFCMHIRIYATPTTNPSRYQSQAGSSPLPVVLCTTTAGYPPFSGSRA